MSDHLNQQEQNQQEQKLDAPSATSEQWYIIQQASGQCEIVLSSSDQADLSLTAQWGPFLTKNDAIAKRVGLIRSGKCHPA